MRRSLSAAAAGLALSGVLGACGGGVSKASYLTKADAACASGNASLDTAAKPTNLPELAAAASAIAATTDGQADAMRKLSPPGDDKALVTTVIGALAEVGAPARALADAAAKTDDRVTAQRANDLKTTVDAAAALARSYQFAACGTGLQAPATTTFEGARTVLKAAFVARAESLCVAANRKAEALAQPTSLATMARYLTSYLVVEEKLFTDIRALAVAPGDEAVVADMLATQDKAIGMDKQLLAAATARNQSTFDRVDEEAIPVFTAANAKFDAYGLRTCGTLSVF